MPLRSTTFNAAFEPVTTALPPAVAAAVGEIVARHGYLDWVLGQVMYDLMEISVKQGRVIMKLPRPRVYVTAVRELFEFHRIAGRFDFDAFATRLEAAHIACREVTRSVYMRDSSEPGVVHVVRSPWDPGPGGEMQPEAQRADAKYLAARRKQVEDAVKAAEKLRGLTDRLLRDSHAKRLRPGFDRRR
jgi:hypothetical protein